MQRYENNINFNTVQFNWKDSDASTFLENCSWV